MRKILKYIVYGGRLLFSALLPVFTVLALAFYGLVLFILFEKGHYIKGSLLLLGGLFVILYFVGKNYYDEDNYI
jgi:hypothetical protein